MLKTESLHFSYDASNAFQFPDIQIENGEHLLVLGQSGVGKSTLIQILAGLLKPSSGNVELDGTVFDKLSLDQLDQFRGKNIGLIFQRPHFIQSLTLEENINMSLFLSNNKQKKAEVDSILEQVGLGSKKKQNPYSLSQGEQQRAAIAMSLVKKPNVILADEPTASLDDYNCEIISTLLQDYCEKNNAKLIVVTHDQRLKNHFNKSISL